MAGPVCIVKIPPIVSAKNVPGVVLVYVTVLAPCVIDIVPPLVANSVN